MSDWAQLLERIAVPVVVAIIGAVVAFLTARLGKKGDRENAQIDQLQEDLKEERGQRKDLADRVTKQEADMAEMRDKVNRLLTRDTLWEIHSTRVEAQVTSLGGDPHPRPEGLAK